MLLEALSAAADEITRELAPGSVEVRLRAGDPEFVVARCRGTARRAGRGAAAARARRGRHRAHQPAAAGGAEGRRRAGRGARAPVGQRLADPRRRRRGRDRRPAAPARRPRRPVLQGVGAMTFETPRPVSATVGLIIGELRLTASERDTTVVEVRPSDATNKEDVQAAEKTRVECAGGRLTVTAPRSRSWTPRSTGGSIEVTIELPAGSSLQASGQLADFVCDGPARRLPDQERPRPDQRRSGRDAQPQVRRGGHRRRARRRLRGARDRLGRRPRGRARLQRRDQELQRRHLGRRGGAGSCG